MPDSESQRIMYKASMKFMYLVPEFASPPSSSGADIEVAMEPNE